MPHTTNPTARQAKMMIHRTIRNVSGDTFTSTCLPLDPTNEHQPDDKQGKQCGQ